MCRADGPGSFDLRLSEMEGRVRKAVHKLLFTSKALVERFTCFHLPTIKRRC
jgi:hypothetical protein